MKKIYTIIIVIFLLLLAIIWKCSDENRMYWINNAILFATAIIVLWYTVETSEMKRAIVKQNLLQTRPILILELDKPHVLLRNEGSGPALNGSVDKFKVRLLKKDRLHEVMSDYEFNSIDFIPMGKSSELIMKRKDIESGKKGALSESDVFFQLGYTVYITLLYEDIEGSKYKSYIEVQSGSSKKILFDKL